MSCELVSHDRVGRRTAQRQEAGIGTGIGMPEQIQNGPALWCSLIAAR